MKHFFKNTIHHILGGPMGHKEKLSLREKFPKLSTEYSDVFRLFFNADNTMNKFGQDVNQMLKEKHRERTSKKKRR